MIADILSVPFATAEHLPAQTEQDSRLSKQELVKRFLEGKRVLTAKDNLPNPFAFHLLGIEWGVFGSLTWKDDNLRKDTAVAAQRRIKETYRLIAAACYRLHLRPRNLLVYIKSERAKRGGGHAHFLISRKGVNLCPRIMAQTLQALWTGKGTAVVKAFDKQRATKAVEYVCKREWDSTGRELETFDSLSDGLRKHLRQAR